MKVLVCGGRDYKDYGFVAQTLQRIHEVTPITELATGHSKGADRLAEMWAGVWHVPIKDYLAHWDEWGKKAGPIRNQFMLDDFKPDIVLAFPGGRGTAHMVNISKTAGVNVVEPALLASDL